jgi:hypothetical protein
MSRGAPAFLRPRKIRTESAGTGRDASRLASLVSCAMPIRCRQPRTSNSFNASSAARDFAASLPTKLLVDVSSSRARPPCNSPIRLDRNPP